jgi:hypothetical protein
MFSSQKKMTIEVEDNNPLEQAKSQKERIAK